MGGRGRGYGGVKGEEGDSLVCKWELRGWERAQQSER